MPKRTYYGWVMVWALGITTIVSYGTTQYLFGVLVVPIQNDLGWSRAQISGAFSLGFVVSGLLGLPIGRLTDRHGARWLMSSGSVLATAGLVLLSGVHQLWAFYLVWSGCLGLAMALVFYPVTFVVVTNWFVRRRGTAMALLTVVGGLASPAFVPLAGFLVSRAGWRETVLLLAFVNLLVALPIHALVIRRHPEDLGLRPDGAAAGDLETAPLGGLHLNQAVAKIAFWTLTFSSAAGVLAQGVLLGHQVAYLIGRGYDPVLSSAVAGLVGAASIPGRLIFNLISDRFGPQRLLGLSALLQAAGVAILVSASSIWLLWAYVLVYGAAFGAVSPLRASAMADQFGRQAFGAITAAQGIPVALAAAVGPIAAGYLYDRTGSYQLALWLTVITFVAAALAVFATPPAGPAPAPAARASS